MEKTFIETSKGIILPYIKKIIDSWIEPKIDKYILDSKISRELLKEDLTQKFSEYLIKIYEENSFLRSFVLKNKQKKLNDLYIPLTLVSTKDQRLFRIDGYPDNFIPVYKKVLIVDTAGMGKSTLLKKLFLSSVEFNKGIPIFFELRNFERNEDIITKITKIVSPLDESIDRDVIIYLLKRGDFIFFFDGYDEINLENKPQIIQNILDFISNTYRNHFIISSRDEESLASLTQFQRFNIKPLRLEEAFNLINKYDENGITGSRLIEKIQEDENFYNIQEFLKNPLLVSLLYKSFEYKPKIQYKKYLYYDQVFDALYESHDFSKPPHFERPKYSGLNSADFKKVLRYLGSLTYKEGSILYSKEHLIYLIEKTKDYLKHLKFSESDFLKDLIETVPLFYKEGLDYRWAHKSIQEYFVASYICYEAKNKYVSAKKIYSVKDINVMDIFQEMDEKTFNSIVTKDILEKYFTIFSHCNQFTKDKIKYKSIIVRTYLILLGECIFSTFVPGGKPNIKYYSKERETEILDELVNNCLDLFITTPKEWDITHFTYNTIFTSYNDKNTQYIKILKNKKYDIFREIELNLQISNQNTGIKSSDTFCHKVDINFPDVSKNNLQKNYEIINSQLCKILSLENNIDITIFDLEKCQKLLLEINTYKENDDIF